MQKIQQLFQFIKKTFNANCKIIFKFFSGVILLIIASFAVEFFVFDKKGEVAVISPNQITMQGFEQDSNGEFISRSENALLTVQNDGTYINNLEIDLGKNPKYFLTIHYLNPKYGQKVSLENEVARSMLKSKKTFLDDAIFHIDGNPQMIEIVALMPDTTIKKITINTNQEFNFIRLIYIFAIGLLAWILYLIRNIIGKKPEWGFLAVALICGSLITFTELKTYVSWDERIHHDIAKQALGVQFGYTVPDAIPSSYSLSQQSKIDAYVDASKGNASFKLKKIRSALKHFYNQLGHMPSAFVMIMGGILHMPNHVVFTLARWVNVWVYALVVFFAIRKLNSGKMLMATIALFPTALFLSANYGYDSWVTSWILLGSAYFFSELQEPTKKITKRDLVIMLSAFVVGLGPKAIYFPLMFMLFLMPREKFASTKVYKKYLLIVSVLIVLVVSSFLLPFLIQGPGNGDRRGGDGVNSAKQVVFILTNPIAYTKILLNFLKEYLNPLNSAGMITFFAYLGSFKGFGVVLITLAVAMFTDKNDYDKKTLTLKMKIIQTLIFFVCVSLISTVLYIAFTPVGNKVILGVQPRYLIPLLFPLLYVLGSARIKNPFKDTIYNMLIFAVMATLILHGVLQLIVNKYF